MIQKVEMFTVICDNCGDDAGAYSDYSCWADSDRANVEAENTDWVEKEGKHYCPKCYIYDNDGRLVII